MGRWAPDARQRLQEAALTLYGERGYEETTVAEIAERAGLTKRTFFRYFADKREVLFWGSELLEQQMVAAIEAAPDGTSALGMLDAALSAAAVRFEEAREFAGTRHRIIASSPELQERELIKGAALSAGVARALRERGVPERGAALAGLVGASVMRVAFEEWVRDPGDTPFERFAAGALADLHALTRTP
jgi:AcrR family transcriptional regulator